MIVDGGFESHNMIFNVVLMGGPPWGLRLQGGTEHAQPITVSKINPNSKAYREGVCVGDHIKAINGQKTEGLLHSDAQQLIRNATNKLVLNLQRIRSVNGEVNKHTHTQMNADSIDSSHCQPPHELMMNQHLYTDQHYPPPPPAAASLPWNQPPKYDTPGKVFKPVSFNIGNGIPASSTTSQSQASTPSSTTSMKITVDSRKVSPRLSSSSLSSPALSPPSSPVAMSPCYQSSIEIPLLSPKSSRYANKCYTIKNNSTSNDLYKGAPPQALGEQSRGARITMMTAPASSSLISHQFTSPSFAAINQVPAPTGRAMYSETITKPFNYSDSADEALSMEAKEVAAITATMSDNHTDAASIPEDDYNRSQLQSSASAEIASIMMNMDAVNAALSAELDATAAANAAFAAKALEFQKESPPKLTQSVFLANSRRFHPEAEPKSKALDIPLHRPPDKRKNPGLYLQLGAALPKIEPLKVQHVTTVKVEEKPQSAKPPLACVDSRVTKRAEDVYPKNNQLKIQQQCQLAELRAQQNKLDELLADFKVSPNYSLPSSRKLINSRPGQSAPASPRVKRQYSRTTSHDQFPAQSSSVPSSPKSKGMSLFLRQQQRLIKLGADIPDADKIRPLESAGPPPHFPPPPPYEPPSPNSIYAKQLMQSVPVPVAPQLEPKTGPEPKSAGLSFAPGPSITTNAHTAPLYTSLNRVPIKEKQEVPEERSAVLKSVNEENPNLYFSLPQIKPLKSLAYNNPPQVHPSQPSFGTFSVPAPFSTPESVQAASMVPPPFKSPEPLPSVSSVPASVMYPIVSPVMSPKPPPEPVFSMSPRANLGASPVAPQEVYPVGPPIPVASPIMSPPTVSPVPGYHSAMSPMAPSAMSPRAPPIRSPPAVSPVPGYHSAMPPMAPSAMSPIAPPIRSPPAVSPVPGYHSAMPSMAPSAMSPIAPPIRSPPAVSPVPGYTPAMAPIAPPAMPPISPPAISPITSPAMSPVPPPALSPTGSLVMSPIPSSLMSSLRTPVLTPTPPPTSSINSPLPMISPMSPTQMIEIPVQRSTAATPTEDVSIKTFEGTVIPIQILPKSKSQTPSAQPSPSPVVSESSVAAASNLIGESQVSEPDLTILDSSVFLKKEKPPDIQQNGETVVPHAPYVAEVPQKGIWQPGIVETSRVQSEVKPVIKEEKDPLFKNVAPVWQPTSSLNGVVKKEFKSIRPNFDVPSKTIEESKKELVPEIKPEDSFAWKSSNPSKIEKVPTSAFTYQPLTDPGGSSTALTPSEVQEAPPAISKPSPAIPAIETTMTITPAAPATTSQAKELSPPPVGLAATIINRSEHKQNHLPQTQSPDVILLQKRRDVPNLPTEGGPTVVGPTVMVSEAGEIPKGAMYLGSKESVEGNFKHTDNYYAVPTEQKTTTSKVVETKLKKYEGIGPVNEQGMPLAFRMKQNNSKNIEGENQHDWYKQMYKTIHRGDKREDFLGINELVDSILREAENSPYALSDDLDSILFDDDTGYKSATESRYSRSGSLERNRSHSVSSKDKKTIWSPPDARSNSHQVFKIQPRSIVDYEPGCSSIAFKESKPNNFHNPPLEKPGDFSQYTTGVRGKQPSHTVQNGTKDDNENADPLDMYKKVQSGGDIPIRGLQKPAPEKPKQSLEVLMSGWPNCMAQLLKHSTLNT